MLGRDVALVVAGGVTFLSAHRRGETWPVSYARFCAMQAVLLVGLYCAHSGLASVQIGWMRVIGHTVPERYSYPLFAGDPQDFWHRWNIWVSRWARRYLYIPIARPIGRRQGGRVGALIGVVGAFVGVGILHDLGAYAFRLEQGWRTPPSPRFTILFLLLGLVLVVWAQGKRAAAVHARAVRPWLRGALLGVSRFAYLNLVFLLASLAIPLLRSGAFPPQIEALLHWGHFG